MNGSAGPPSTPVEESSSTRRASLNDEQPSSSQGTAYGERIQDARHSSPPVVNGEEPPAYGEPPAYEAVPHSQLYPNASGEPLITGEAQSTGNDGHGNSEIEPAAPERAPSRGSTVSTEPFPEYDASTARPPSVLYQAQVEAYEYALSKLAEDIARGRTIQDTDPPAYTRDHQVANGTPTAAMQDVPPCQELTHHDHYCHENETRKMNVRARINRMLTQESVSAGVRRQYTLLANMVIELEFILFREKNFPRSPLTLVTDYDLRKILKFGMEINRFFSHLACTVRQSKAFAQHSLRFVQQTERRTDLTVLERYRAMSKILITPHMFLETERPFEQELVELFFQFYETFFFDDFHFMYNNHLAEHLANGAVAPKLIKVGSLLHTVNTTLYQLVDNYRVMRNINIDIGQRFIVPVLEQLSNIPGIWDQCLQATESIRNQATDQRGQETQPALPVQTGARNSCQAANVNSTHRSSPIQGEILDYDESRDPVAEGYRFHSQIVDLNPSNATPQIHTEDQAYIPFRAEPQYRIAVRPPPSNWHNLLWLDQRPRAQPHNLWYTAVEYLHPYEGRYIHAMVQKIRDNAPFNFRYSRIWVPSRQASEYLSHGLLYFPVPFPGYQNHVHYDDGASQSSSLLFDLVEPSVPPSA
ncbi:uncharacterized protein BJX67DRAFT_107049 [Aspergillus lucknowensis]|uniref:Uncharacterized protein n=1 Tax=Aspergillus lucknowensis TaxID=176173 RepID=A0ABR4LRP2_9EURO